VRVRLLSRRLSRIYDAALRPHGITVAQLNLLTLIQSVGRAPSGRIADLLSMEISTLSRNARIMEKEGWLTIEHAERGNGRLLGLTPAGAAKLEECLPAWEHAQDVAKDLLGAAGTGDLKRLGDELWSRQPIEP